MHILKLEHPAYFLTSLFTVIFNIVLKNLSIEMTKKQQQKTYKQIQKKIKQKNLFKKLAGTAKLLIESCA